MNGIGQFSVNHTIRYTVTFNIGFFIFYQQNQEIDPSEAGLELDDGSSPAT